MDVLLEKELQKLSSGNYQKAPDIKDSIENILFEGELTPPEIGLCSSKIFASNDGFMEYLANHVMDRDTFYSNTKKVIYQIMAKYIKRFTSYVSEYLETILSECIQNFKREDSGVAKDASLLPIIKIYKCCDQGLLGKLSLHQNLFHILLQECMVGKNTAGVKGRIFSALGILIKRFAGELELPGIFAHSFDTLKGQVTSQKPEMVIVEGLLKFFRQALISHTYNEDKVKQIFNMIMVLCQPLETLATYKVPIAAIKCMKENLGIFGQLIVIKSNAVSLFEQYIKMLNHKNKDVKEEVQELLELFIQKLSELLNHKTNDHMIIFNTVLNKFIDILNKPNEDVFLLTVVIRSVGQFAKAIVNIRGERQLSEFFDKLNELGMERLLKVYEDFYRDDQGEMNKGAQFKVLLYRQKQLNSFVISYANIVKSLTKITDKQVQHLFELCLLCIKQHYNYFENYKPYLYDGMANLIIAISGHQNFGVQFINTLFSKGIYEGLKLGQNQEELYIKTCQEMARLWIGVVEQKSWTQHDLMKVMSAFFDQVAQLINNCCFESQQKEVNNDEQFQFKIQEFRYFAVNPASLTSFHRFILMLSALLPKIPIESSSMQIATLLNIVIIKLRKYPRTLLLLILARVLLKYVRDSIPFLDVKVKAVLINQLHKLRTLVFGNLKIYSQQLHVEGLCLLLTVPLEILVKDNYLLLKQEYVQILISSFQIGQTHNYLSWSAIELLVQLIQSEYNKKQNNLKYLLRILKNVIPHLSSYMQIVSEQEKPNYAPITYIDCVEPNVLLSELHIDRNLIVDKVRFFLGSIGGLCHLIVDETYSESLLALDYQSPITINVPIGTRKLKIRFGQFLERILYLCQNAPLEKSKVYACELLQAFVIYMIGDQATNQTKAIASNIKKKIEYANMYKRIFPVMIDISNTLGHPCKAYFKEHLTRIVHWFANSKQYEAPDVAQLMDCLFEVSTKDDPQMETFCSQLIGEFVLWTLKQTTPESLKLNYSNIKTVMRRIITYANHPDMRYKTMALECILQFVKYTQKEKFIVSKYYLEIIEQLKSIFQIEDKDITKVISNTNNVIEIVTNSFKLFSEELQQLVKGRQGKNRTLDELLDFLLNEAMTGKDGGWQQAALNTWYLTVKKIKNGRDILISQISESGQRLILFPKYPFRRLQGERSDDIESLAWQCRVWQFVFDRGLFTLEEITRFEDFHITVINIHEYLKMFALKKNIENIDEMLFTLTQENFNPSQIFTAEGTNIQISLPEKMVEQVVSTFERVYRVCRLLQIDTEHHINVSLSLIFKPTHVIRGLQLDLYQGQVEAVITEIQRGLKGSIQFGQIKIILNDLFEWTTPLKVIIKIKDLNELKFLIKGVQWAAEECSKEQECVIFYQKFVEEMGQIIIANEYEQSGFLFEFLLQIQESKNFILSQLIKHSDFRQKHEQQLIDYLARNYQANGQVFFQLVCSDVSLLRLGVLLVSKVSPDVVHVYYGFQFKINRENSSLLLLEIQINNIILNATRQVNQEYLKELLRVAMLPSQPIEIHIDAIVLFGLYVKHIDKNLPNYLGNLANRYFPIRMSELKAQEEQNFKVILRKLMDMIKICNMIEFIEVLFPLLRQDLNLDILDLVQVNEYSQIKWLMLQVQDIELDNSLLHNVRIALANKLLIPLLENCQFLMEFYTEFTPYLMQQLTVFWDDNWQQMLFQVQWRTLIFDLFGILYKQMSADQIKKQLHPALKYATDNELTKKLIIECNKASKYKFEKINILHASQKEILATVNYNKIVEDYQCSAFITYIYVLVKTQTKENIFYTHLFKRDKDIPYWDHFINREWYFNFQVETNFEEKPLIIEVKKQQQDYFQERIVKNYLYTASLDSQFEIQERDTNQMQIEEEIPQNVQKLEMDEVNQHKLMIPMLQLIDFMAAKFLSEGDMPSWMTALKQVFREENLSLALRVFMLKIIINKSDIFGKYASGWIAVLLEYCTKENKNNGGKGFHYFLRDVVVVLIKFSQNPQVREEFIHVNPQSKFKLCSVINYLIMISADKNKKIFDSNIEILGMFVQVYREHIYISDKSIVDMINPPKANKEPIEDNTDLWQANGLAILHLALSNKVVLLQDYSEFVRTVAQPVIEKYRFIYNKAKFPSEQLYKLSVTYTTKKHILKGIANVYGSLLQCCQALKLKVDYEGDIIKIMNGVMEDSRPGYGKQKFTEFMKVLTYVYPPILNNTKLFHETASLIMLASNKERAAILQIFGSFLQQIELSNDPQFYINEIVVSVCGSIDKVLEDQEESVHFALLDLLKQLGQLKCLNECTQLILHCFNSILDKMDNKYGVHYQIGIVKNYLNILRLLHEYLLNYEHKELQVRVTTHLISLFTSQHAEVRDVCFKYLQDDLDRKAIQQQYNNQQSTQIDRVVQLMRDIYQPAKEQLWLKGAVPLLLSQSLKTSEYDSQFFDKNLSDEAHYYDQEFNNKKYFRQANMSQYESGSQFSQFSSSQLLSQAVGVMPQRVVRQTQESQSQYMTDTDGFKIPPTKGHRSHLSQFMQANEISFQQIQLTSNNQIRYRPESAASQTSRHYYKLKQGTPSSTQEGFEKFVQNKVRKYREGELPDIRIKHKDIVDPLIVLCFEDEELAGRVFTALFQELYERNTQADKLYEVLLNLIEQSKQKTFIFISTVLRTLHQVLCKSGTLLPENRTVKKIGMDSLAYYQSMILTEECILRVEEDNERLKSNFWLDLMDLHQSQGNKAQMEGIVSMIFEGKGEFERIKLIMDAKHQYSFTQSNQQLEELLEQIKKMEFEEDSIDARMIHYLQQEFEDTCMKLGQWEKLDAHLPDISQLTDKELLSNIPLIRRTFHKYLSVNKGGEIDLQRAKYLEKRTENLSNQFLLEKTLILISEQDIDQSRYVLQKAQKQFLSQWTGLLSQNQLLSKQLRHKHLENLQLMHEMGEIQSIYTGLEIDIDKKLQVFNTWAVRSPSLQDSLYTWNRIYQDRLIMANQTDPIFGKWALQMAKGMVKMNYFQPATNLLTICFKLYKYTDQSSLKTLSKLKLKQERFESERRDLESVLQNLGADFDHYQQYAKLRLYFEQQNTQDKLPTLPLKTLQHYLKINQDLVFMFNQQNQKRYDFMPFYERYASVIQQAFHMCKDIQKVMTEEKASAKFFSKAALFCERCLRVIEPDSGGSNDLRKILENKHIGLDMMADQFVRYTISTFKYGSVSKSETLLIKVLKVVQKFPHQIGPIFADAIEKGHLSTWVFLQYLPQLIHLIGDEVRITYFNKIFVDFIKKYPQQFVYQFNVTYQFRSECKTPAALTIYDQLHNTIPRNYLFIEALNLLTHPEHRLVSYLGQIKDNPEEYDLIVEKMQEDFFSKKTNFYGSYNQAYIQKKRNVINQIMRSKDMDVINKLYTEISNQDCKQIQIKSQQMIHDMSQWFQNYNEESLDMIGKKNEILIPMKLNNLNEIDIHMIPKIASFDQGMLVLSSIRKPKRIRVYGTDEKQYFFLVKGGEDLRLDQRIELLFDVMNKILPDSELCTYGVFPMTKMFGMLEWVDNTTVLKDVIEKEHQDEEGLELYKSKAMTKRDEYVTKLAKKLQFYREGVATFEPFCVLYYDQSKNIIDQFNDQKKYVKDTLLRNGLCKMSATIEAFVFIRDKFLVNYAGICSSGYLLGIGDRHLENILLNYQNGNLIAIDFGYSFGQGLALPIPELLPFRLTQVFEGLAKPIGLGGLFRNQFIKLMTHFRKKRHILLDFCEVFINDPLTEQIKIGKTKGISEEYKLRIQEQSKIEEQVYQKESMMSGSYENPSNQQKLQETWYSRKKIEIVLKKLIGVHCSLILLEEFDDSRHCNAKYAETIKKAISGQETNRLRYNYLNQQTLSVIQQVDCLIDMATDPNILGRAWKGWGPFF